MSLEMGCGLNPSNSTPHATAAPLLLESVGRAGSSFRGFLAQCTTAEIINFNTVKKVCLLNYLIYRNTPSMFKLDCFAWDRHLNARHCYLPYD